MEKLRISNKIKIAFCIVSMMVFTGVFAGIEPKKFGREIKQGLTEGVEKFAIALQMPLLRYDKSENDSLFAWIEKQVMEITPLYQYCLEREEETANALSTQELIAEIQKENGDTKTEEIIEKMVEENHTEQVTSKEVGSKETEEKKETEEENEKKEETEEIAQKEETVPYSGDFRKDVLNVYKKKNLKKYSYLIEHFYHVDATTELPKSQLRFMELFYEDLTIRKEGKHPKILIYHTHSQEGYQKEKNKKSKTVVDVGNYLTKLLEEEYGIEVLHHTGEYDVKDRDGAYSRALPELEKIIEEYPSIEVMIDLHRDGVAETTHLVTEVNGKKTAQIMFFNGVSRSKVNGKLDYLQNDHLEGNLAFSMQMQLAARTYYPTLTRNVYIKGYRYNMHLMERSLLVEVGAQNNTFEEAKNAMGPLAELLNRVLFEN